MVCVTNQTSSTWGPCILSLGLRFLVVRWITTNSHNPWAQLTVVQPPGWMGSKGLTLTGSESWGSLSSARLKWWHKSCRIHTTHLKVPWRSILLSFLFPKNIWLLSLVLYLLRNTRLNEPVVLNSDLFNDQFPQTWTCTDNSRAMFV